MNKKLHQDVFIGIVLVAVSAFLYLKTLSFTKGGAALFPQMLIVLLTFFGAFIIYIGIKKTKQLRQSVELEYAGEEEEMSKDLLRSPAVTLIYVVAYALLLSILGFFPATILFLAAFLWFKKVRDWKVYIYVLSIVNLFIYVVFVLQLNVQLPLGIFFE